MNHSEHRLALDDGRVVIVEYEEDSEIAAVVPRNPAP
jgi:hypothetical protein